jgi:hypothetical protein
MVIDVDALPDSQPMDSDVHERGDAVGYGEKRSGDSSSDSDSDFEEGSEEMRAQQVRMRQQRVGHSDAERQQRRETERSRQQSRRGGNRSEAEKKERAAEVYRATVKEKCSRPEHACHNCNERYIGMQTKQRQDRGGKREIDPQCFSTRVRALSIAHRLPRARPARRDTCRNVVVQAVPGQ